MGSSRKLLKFDEGGNKVVKWLIFAVEDSVSCSYFDMRALMLIQVLVGFIIFLTGQSSSF